MNQISIAICDADSAYGNKLAEYLLETGNVAKAEVYTDWNSVEADLNGEKRDIWLINSGRNGMSSRRAAGSKRGSTATYL